jgi:hemerythrin-like domain-containing protein
MAKTQLDAIAALKKDHQAVEQLFRKFERARGATERKRLSDRIVRELSVHAAIEEQLVYPQLRRRLDGGQGPVLVALEEHHLAKVALAEIEGLPGEDERFEAKVHVLIESVRRHVAEEERELLPAMRKLFKPDELADLGDLLQRAKRVAPTRPHPTAPDQPPANIVTTPAAAVMDRSRDAVERSIERVIERGRGVVDAALRRGEEAARYARQRLGRGLERAGREVRPSSH